MQHIHELLCFREDTGRSAEWVSQMRLVVAETTKQASETEAARQKEQDLAQANDELAAAASLHPGASFKVRYVSGSAMVSVYRPDGASPGLLDVNSEDYRKLADSDNYR